jgi:hypothetical protein
MPVIQNFGIDYMVRDFALRNLQHLLAGHMAYFLK